MLTSGKNLVFIGLIFLALFAFKSSAIASDSTYQLQKSVQALNEGLVQSQHGDGWRRYLRLNVLQTQAAKGEQADLLTLQEIRNRFYAQEESLQHPLFASVRNALDRQIAVLSGAQFHDLSLAVAEAQFRYSPPTVELAERYRELAKWELKAFKKYARKALPSYERAKLFYDLKLDQRIAFLDEISIVTAPQVSVGKLNSMISEVRAQLRAVERKIDALPFEEEEGDESAEQEPETPTPDDGVESREDLQRQLERLEQQMEKLQVQRRDVRSIDLPRLRERALALLEMQNIEKELERIGKAYPNAALADAEFAFNRFARVFRFTTDDNLQEEYILRIQKLAEDVLALDDPLNRAAAGRVGETLEWLEESYQAPYLVAAIRARYSFPNAYVKVSANLLNHVASQPIREDRTIDENISGRLVRGHLSTNGLVTLELQDDPNQVHASVRLNVDLNSDTYLRQRSIYAFVGTSGQVEARRSIFANVGGVFAEQPYAASYVDSQFRGTSSQFGLVNRIAQKKFYESKPSADVGAANQFRDETLERFEPQTSDAVSAGKKALAQAMKRAKKIGRYVPQLYAYSTSNNIVLVGKKSTPATLGAPNRPMESGISPDVQVRLHETMLSNYLSPIFRGKEFSNAELAAELEAVFGVKAAGLNSATGGQEDQGLEISGPSEDAGDDQEEELNDEPFTITFADVRPIQIQFEYNGFAVAVNGKKFSQGSNEIKAGLIIILRFKIKRN